MSRNACNGENGKNGEKSPASDNLSWMPKVAAWRLAILAKLALLGKIARGLAIMAIMEKNVPAPWRVVILAKLAILAKIARGLAIMAKNVPAPWRVVILAKLAILAKIARGLAIMAKNVPETGDFGEVFVIFKHVNGWPHCFQS